MSPGISRLLLACVAGFAAQAPAAEVAVHVARSGDAFDYPREVKFDEPVAANPFGGTGMFFTGTVGVNAVHVTGWRTIWDQ